VQIFRIAEFLPILPDFPMRAGIMQGIMQISLKKTGGACSAGLLLQGLFQPKSCEYPFCIREGR
jgi:hypothetical protein